MKATKRITQCLLISVVGVAVILGLLAGLKWHFLAPVREMERTARAMVGQPEADILKALGQPMHVVSAATLAGRTVDYPWKGMNFVPVPNRPVRNKVLLYSKLNVAIYVYVDERGFVEYVAIAGT